MKIFNQMPVIITSDKTWATQKHEAKPGHILLLPEDAVLVVKEVEMPKDEEE